MDFDFSKSYPSEFEYIADLVREARKQMDQMNQGMVNFPDKGVASAFDKPKEGEWRFGKRVRLIDALEDAQAAYFRAIRDWVAEDVEHEHVDPKIAQWIKRSASFDLGPLFSAEVLATKTREPNRATTTKEVSSAAVPVTTEKAINKVDKGIQEPDQPVKPDKVLPSLSMRYSQELSFTKATDKTKTSLDKQLDKEIDKDIS